MRATSTRSRGALLVLASLFWALVPPPPVSGQDSEPYLQGPQGPYRGRVVELLTEKPLPGALVFIIWESDTADYGRREFAAREVLTNDAGEFVVESSAIEANLPPRAFPPQLLIYKPGYVTYPRDPRQRFGVPAARFIGAGGVAPLKPVRDEEERVEAFNTFFFTVKRYLGAGVLGAPSFAEFNRIMRQELEQFLRNPGVWEKRP